MPLKLVEMLRNSWPRSTAPSKAQELMQRAQAWQQQGKFVEAVRLYDELIAGDDTNPETYYKRANALNGLERWAAALADYDRAINLNSAFSNAHCNRGYSLERLSRWQAALDSYDRAVALNAADFLAHYNRGGALKQLGQLDEALASYQQAITLKSDYSEAYVNRGNVLQELHRHEAAIESYSTALAFSPNLGEVFKSRGASLHSLRQFETAIQDYNRAYSLAPDSNYLLGMRRHAHNQICDWSGLASDLKAISRGLQKRTAVCTPFSLLSLSDSLVEHRQAAEIWCRDTCPPSNTLSGIPPRPSRSTIRLGYFSADFRNHPVSLLTAGLFESHDRSQFEVTAFSFGPVADDPLRDRLKKGFDRFIEVGTESDERVASLSRQMEIDIAVDLGGFTEHSRTGIFSLRAAPVQVNFLGYPGTMGTDYMDYIVGDKTVIPPGHRRHYSEKVICLPDCFMPTDPNRVIANAEIARADLGLPPNGFVFCCFNNSYKILPDRFDSWMRILGRVDNSVLWLSWNNHSAAANLRQAAVQRGIDAARIIFADRVASWPEHLARHRGADLFLDTFPYGAHATAVDSLSAGLPLLTCAGQSFVSRVAASFLTTLGLPELIAQSPEEYEQIAIHLATDDACLSKIREKLSRNLLATPLFNLSRYTTNLEAAYRVIYQRRQNGLGPQHVLFPHS
jgi:predicted O-linked N-acetylglucosamine transferase (SPINDLY family)